MSLGVAIEACCFAIAAIMVTVRLTMWRSAPESRPFTMALTSLMLGSGLRHPVMLSSPWLDSRTAGGVHLCNFTDLLGDLLVATAAGYLGILVARAWGAEEVGPWIVRGVVAAAILMVSLWSISDAPTTAAKYVGDLGGPAVVYSYVAAIIALTAHLAILATVMIVRVPNKIRLALLPLGLAALLGVAKNILRLAANIGMLTDIRDTLSWPMSLAMITLYSLSGLVGFMLTAPHRRR
ncbi:hypothetical protein ACFOS0_07700 [Nocardia seriolae]|uniref:hypothetical protein n=1 Tax=Nocardia seriolae TaxID=37332 RepID=UPI001192966C|nr:hypothetical protein [Nocardia seriolae]GEM27350.1 hypothetical protein NS2_55890 [Nocardia seriolae NBRC 15557]